MATCVIPVCDRPQAARGLCDSHYHRWHRLGENADLVSPVRQGASRPSPTPWNPWAYRQACPECGSSEFTMPIAPGETPGWRCVWPCHITFTPEPT